MPRELAAAHRDPGENLVSESPQQAEEATVYGHGGTDGRRASLRGWKNRAITDFLQRQQPVGRMFVTRAFPGVVPDREHGPLCLLLQHWQIFRPVRRRVIFVCLR